MPFTTLFAERAAPVETAPKVRVVGNRAELAKAIKVKGVGAAVYEAPKHRYADAIERLNYALYEALDIVFAEIRGCDATDHAALDKVAQRAKRPLFRRLSAEDITLFAKVIDSIIEDLKSILDNFPDHTIRAIHVKTGENAVTDNNREWHPDGEVPNLNIVRTYCGPSTEYASDGHGTNRQSFAQGAITIHDGDMYHRGPAAVPGRERFAVAIRLAPKKKR